MKMWCDVRRQAHYIIPYPMESKGCCCKIQCLGLGNAFFKCMKVKMHFSQQSKLVRLVTDKHFENIRTMFNTLYTDELFADVTLCCRNGTIKAHKVVLASCSPYFRRVFIEHNKEQLVFIMYGIDYMLLKSLIELIYKGSIDLPDDVYRLVCNLAEELGVSGVLIDATTSIDHSSAINGCDTIKEEEIISEEPQEAVQNLTLASKGQKRVMFDFEEAEPINTKQAKVLESELDKPSTLETSIENEPNTINDCSDSADDKTEPQEPNNERISSNVGIKRWPVQERKFTCSLCPSSFKRASHLTRHQLVHTGERPFACNWCDKAFSRHDKLKHHVKKFHEDVEPSNVGDYISEDFYVLKCDQLRALETEFKSFGTPACETSDASASLKKGRGRPRKKALELNLLSKPNNKYDLATMPYGDIELLTKSMEEGRQVDTTVMEPLVQIEESFGEKNGDQVKDKSVANIGECTVSISSKNST